MDTPPLDGVFSVTVEQGNHEAVLRLSGELDSVGEPDLRSAFEQVLSQDLVVVDLRGLTFIDSLGLSTLVWATTTRTHEGRPPLRFVPGPEQVQRVFEITQVDQRLQWVNVA